MTKQLHILIIEDSEDDALLLLRELKQGGYEPVFERIETAEAMKEALDNRTWEVIISDHSMPQFSGLAALNLLKEIGPDIPFIIVSGNIGEDVAVGAMKAGAHDYIMKGNLARLVPAIERELREAEVRREKRRAEEELSRYQAELERRVAERTAALRDTLIESKHSQKKISALLAASRVVLEQREFKDTARNIFDSCKNLIRATAGYVALLSEDGSENEVLFLDAGGLPCTVDPSLPMPVRGLREAAYRTGKTVYENDFSHSEWMKFMPEGHTKLDNVLFAPMVVQGKTLGILGLGNKQGDFTENDARMATAFGELAAIALQNSRLMEALEKSKDELELKVLERTADLAEKSRILESFFKHTQTCLVFLDRAFNFMRVNEAYAQICGREVSDFAGHNHFDDYPSDELKGKFQRVVETREPYSVTGRPFVFPDHPEWGMTYWNLYVAPVLSDSQEVDFLVFTLIDVTELKKAEENISQLNRLYSVLSKANEAIVRVREPKKLFEKICRIVVEKGAFRLAWVGLLEPESREVRVAASYGESAYLEGIRIVAADVPEGRGPTGRAVREDHYIVYTDFEDDLRLQPWRDKARAHGLRSLAAFPLHTGGRVIGALTIYSDKPGFFNEEEVSLLLSLSEDISFALDSIETEKKRSTAEDALHDLTEELRDHTVHLQEVREAERTSIARDIHDELGQIITALRMDLVWIKKTYEDDEVLFNKSNAMLALVDSSIRSIQNIIASLRPGILDVLGIYAAIEWQAEELKKMTGISCDLMLPSEEVPISEKISTNIFRIVQELFTNIARYAKATIVSLSLNRIDDKLVLAVSDNGVGIRPQDISNPTSFGIIGIRERVFSMGGDIKITGSPGSGTSIRITVPIA